MLKERLQPILNFRDWPIRNKLLVVFLILALVPLAFSSALGLYQSTNALNQVARGQMEAEVDLDGQIILSYLEQFQTDILALSDVPPVPAIARARETSDRVDPESGDSEAVWNQRLEQIYASQARNKEFYQQIRYLGENGKELVRVDYRNGQVQIVQGSRLQDKADNDYFTEASKLQTGQVYISDLNLNRENGVIEEPHVPVIRFSTPIYVDGEFKGVVVSNVYAAFIFDKLVIEQDIQAGESFYIINGDGYFLFNPQEPETTFGFEFEDGASIADSPLNRVHNAQESSGQQTYSEVADDLGAAIALHDLHFDALNPDRQWVVIKSIPEDVILAPLNTLTYIIVVAFVIIAAIVAVSAFLFARTLTRPIDAITDLFTSIGIGDFEARVEVESNDELGEMANALNSMLDNILELIQSQEERDEIQNSIMKLLDEVSDVAQGDLTVEAEVTADIMGAIADSFNFMIQQLRDIITNVQSTTQQVTSSAGEIRTTAEHLAQGTESQVEQIVDTSAAISEMATSIRQVSENAAMSAAVGDEALDNAQRGRTAVENTIEGMHRIRDQVQETSKRIKRLGESSQEVGEIVQLISDIADRTSILALNASIQAAMAGEAGRGFAVVAEEVERLAERSTDATKQIETLIKTIQSETNEAVAAMETMTQEVVEGSYLADEAGSALSEIEDVSKRLSELIQSISMASRQQARGADTLAKSMTMISEVTQQTAAGTKQAAVSISNLASLADNLRGSVAAFKVPTQNGQN